MGKAFQKWPTPLASDGVNGGPNQKGGSGDLRLSSAVHKWQTPVAGDAVNRKDGKFNSRGEPKLSAQVKLWPTPTANEDAAGRPGANMQKMLGNHPEIRQDPDGGQLNPTWVEWLMGWIPGFTSLEPIDRLLFHIWERMTCDKMGWIQTDSEDVRSQGMFCVWFREGCSQASHRHGPDEHQEGEHPNHLPELPRKGAHHTGERKECPFASMCRLRETFSTKENEKWKGLLKGVPFNHRHDFSDEEVGNGEMGGGMCLLQKAIHSHKGETNHLLAFLWEQARMGKTLWEVEPPIPRVAKGIPKRADRLRCIGNGQVPAAMVLAWRLLTQDCHSKTNPCKS